MIRNAGLKNSIKLSGDKDEFGNDIKNNIDEFGYSFLNKLYLGAKTLSDKSNRYSFYSVFLDLLGAKVKDTINDIDVLETKKKKGKLVRSLNEPNKLREAKNEVIVYNYVVNNPQLTYKKYTPQELIETLIDKRKGFGRKAAEVVTDALSYVFSFLYPYKY